MIAALCAVLRGAHIAVSNAAIADFTGAPRIAPARFRKDVDGLIDQDPTPRA